MIPAWLGTAGRPSRRQARFAERDHQNIVSWNVYDAPGHFAAHQSPDLLVADMRQFFRHFR